MCALKILVKKVLCVKASVCKGVRVCDRGCALGQKLGALVPARGNIAVAFGWLLDKNADPAPRNREGLTTSTYEVATQNRCFAASIALL